MINRAKTQRILLVGGGAREHAIADALCRSRGNVQLLVVASNYNPGLSALASAPPEHHQETDVDWITAWAGQQSIDLAVIGLEDPLDAKLSDGLIDIGIPVVGPRWDAARLETSKIFTRDFMSRHYIPGQVTYHHFMDTESFTRFLHSNTGDFALKPVGLTAGKGVKVMGVHIGSLDEAIAYGESVILTNIGGGEGLVVEERLIGEEFTLQTFVDGETVLPMPLVQDYKRAFEGDLGPNTGGMGSYSQADGLLPFVTAEDRDYALEILRQIVLALRGDGILYQGILYGQFMQTDQGIKLVEINARFGDPEALNVLPLLENDFVDVCHAITRGELRKLELKFQQMATVCKYIAPPRYGTDPVADAPIRLDVPAIESLGVRIFFAKLNQGADENELLTTQSRSVGLVGIADSVEDAESQVEQALQFVTGNYHVRHDIGKKHLLQRGLVKKSEART